jgi:predicted TIM-barrel fold metal-dependent hydrolase
MTCLKELDVCLLAELFDHLAPCRTPVFIDCLDTLEQAATAQLRELLDHWPTLPVIVGFPKVEHDDRRLYCLWERSAQFHLELSGYQTLGAIEAVTQRFGPDRLVFGSKSPYFTPLQSMLQVIYSRIDETAKCAIAGGTLRRLLAEVKL